MMVTVLGPEPFLMTSGALGALTLAARKPTGRTKENLCRV
jgi:hypothetical protein